MDKSNMGTVHLFLKALSEKFQTNKQFMTARGPSISPATYFSSKGGLFKKNQRAERKHSWKRKIKSFR